MIAKEVFLRDKNVAQAWAAIAHSDMFQTVLLHVRAELMTQGMTPEASHGALLFENTLTTIADGEDTIPTMPSLGLDHDLESDLRPNPPPYKPPEPAPPKKKKTKTK